MLKLYINLKIASNAEQKLHNLYVVKRDGAGTSINKSFMIYKKCERNPVLVDLVFDAYTMNTNLLCDASGKFFLFVSYALFG